MKSHPTRPHANIPHFVLHVLAPGRRLPVQAQQPLAGFVLQKTREKVIGSFPRSSLTWILPDIMQRTAVRCPQNPALPCHLHIAPDCRDIAAAGWYGAWLAQSLFNTVWAVKICGCAPSIPFHYPMGAHTVFLWGNALISVSQNLSIPLSFS